MGREAPGSSNRRRPRTRRARARRRAAAPGAQPLSAGVPGGWKPRAERTRRPGGGQAEPRGPADSSERERAARGLCSEPRSEGGGWRSFASVCCSGGAPSSTRCRSPRRPRSCRRSTRRATTCRWSRSTTRAAGTSARPALPPEAAASGAEVTLPAVPGDAHAARAGAAGGARALSRLDVIFPIVHGQRRRGRLAPGPARARGRPLRRRGRARLRAPDGQGGRRSACSRPRASRCVPWVLIARARSCARRRGGGRARARASSGSRSS